MESAEILLSLRDATIVVVGGANTDIVGMSDAPLVARDSNPGHVRVASGGVGRNIAENLARLGVDTHLITAFGADAAADSLAEECRSAGIGISASLQAEDLPGSRYMAIADADGDMALALSDMRALERVTPAFLESEACTSILESATLVVLDANPPETTIRHLVQTCGCPVLGDTVSTTKAVRFADVLPQMDILKANGIEAGALVQREISTVEDGQLAASELVDRGVSRVFLTLGAAGCVYASMAGTGSLVARAPDAVNATGAGDAFTAGLAAAAVAQLDDSDSAALATALAWRTMAVETSVDHDIDPVRIIESAKELLT